MEIRTKNLMLVPLGMKYLLSTHKYVSDIDNARYMVYMPKRDIEETKEILLSKNMVGEKIAHLTRNATRKGMSYISIYEKITLCVFSIDNTPII